MQTYGHIFRWASVYHGVSVMFRIAMIPRRENAKQRQSWLVRLGRLLQSNKQQNAMMTQRSKPQSQTSAKSSWRTSCFPVCPMICCSRSWMQVAIATPVNNPGQAPPGVQTAYVCCCGLFSAYFCNDCFYCKLQFCHKRDLFWLNCAFLICLY